MAWFGSGAWSGRYRLRGAPALAVLLVVLLGSAMQDVLGIPRPRVGGLPGPLSDPAFLLLLAMVAALTWRRTRVSQPGDGIPPLALLPLAVAILGMRAAVDHTWSWLEQWTATPAVPISLSAPLHRLGMGGVLLGTLALLLLLVPRFRVRIQEFTSTQRLRSGVYFTVSVLLVVYAVLLWVGLVVAGPGQIQFQWPKLVGSSAALVFAQAVIALGEEIFYRGVLQTEVKRLLDAAGLRRPRDRRLVAIGAISLLFALEHVAYGMPSQLFWATFLYAFSMSVLFGYLFELTGNLALCSLAHFFNNLMVLRLVPALALPGPVPAFGDMVYMAAFLLVTFSLLFLLGHDSSDSLEPIRPNSRAKQSHQV